MYKSCFLLCIAGVLSHQDTFTYTRPWDPYRRSNVECEMCYHGNCLTTNDARCEYYAETSRVMHDDDEDEEAPKRVDEVDEMMFELVETVTSTSEFKVCVPFVSQYTDCTEETICLGCKVCTCNDEGMWTCIEKQQCRPGPKINIDHHTFDVVIDSLKRKGNKQKKRDKRSAFDVNLQNVKQVTYNDIFTWFYGTELLASEEKISHNLNDVDENATLSDGLNKTENTRVIVPYTPNNEKRLSSTTDTTLTKSENFVDLLEFNDLLNSLSELNTDKPMKFIEEFQHNNQRDYTESYKNDIAHTQFDPVRLVKRDIDSKNQTKIEINSTNINVTYSQILNDALYGLNKITSEKRTELQELNNIRDNLVKIAKAHNIIVNTNTTYSHVNYTKHNIAIYKLDVFDKCVKKIKEGLNNAIEDISKTQLLRNLTSSPRDLKVLLNTIKKHIQSYSNEDRSHNNIDKVSSEETLQKKRRYMEYKRDQVIFHSLIGLSNILTHINKTSADKQINPLSILNRGVRKVIKRAIKQLYFENIAVMELIVHETFNDFDFNNIGTKWDKMMQAIDHSESSDKLHRMKLLHISLNTDIGKMEDMISILEFASYRRMTVANGATIDKSILRINHNLNFINNKVQKIIELQKLKKLGQAAVIEQKTPTKKMSIMQKLKKMFKNSKDDIKDMLRKRFPKSEIIKRIAKKKVDELEKQRKMEYQETMRKWQEKLNIVPKGRKKRFALGFKKFVERINNIIPGYLRGHVKKGMDSKKSNKTRSSRFHGRKKKHNAKTTTVKTTFPRTTS